VAVCGEVLPSGTDPKFTVMGERPRPAPVPLSVIAGGVFDALLVNESEPDTLPVAKGEKLTLKPWLCPGLNVSGKVIPLTANPAPVNVSFVTVTLPPEALSVPDCSALVVPTVMFEKVKLPGEVERTGTVAKFMPVFEALETVICWFAGLKVYPVFVGVTV